MSQPFSIVQMETLLPAHLLEVSKIEVVLLVQLRITLWLSIHLALAAWLASAAREKGFFFFFFWSFCTKFPRWGKSNRVRLCLSLKQLPDAWAEWEESQECKQTALNSSSTWTGGSPAEGPQASYCTSPSFGFLIWSLEGFKGETICKKC